MDNLDEKYKSKNPFTVPDRYFDTLGDRVMDRIKDEDGKTRKTSLFQTLNDIRKANSIIQFVFMMSTYSDEVMTICDWIFKRGFWDNFTFVVNEILHRKYRVLNPYYIPPIAQQQYNILYCNESVKRRLLSILAISAKIKLSQLREK